MWKCAETTQQARVFVVSSERDLNFVVVGENMRREMWRVGKKKDCKKGKGKTRSKATRESEGTELPKKWTKQIIKKQTK